MTFLLQTLFHQGWRANEISLCVWVMTHRDENISLKRVAQDLRSTTRTVKKMCLHLLEVLPYLPLLSEFDPLICGLRDIQNRSRSPHTERCSFRTKKVHLNDTLSDHDCDQKQSFQGGDSDLFSQIKMRITKTCLSDQIQGLNVYTDQKAPRSDDCSHDPSLSLLKPISFPFSLSPFSESDLWEDLFCLEIEQSSPPLLLSHNPPLLLLSSPQITTSLKRDLRIPSSLSSSPRSLWKDPKTFKHVLEDPCQTAWFIRETQNYRTMGKERKKIRFPPGRTSSQREYGQSHSFNRER